MIRGYGLLPGFQGEQCERSHASSEETLLYPEDLPNDNLLAVFENSESTVPDDLEIDKVYEEYLAEGTLTDMGVTIMLRDIPYRMMVEPHIFDILKNTSDLNHVDYIYLPLTEPSSYARNKGYCFVHFWNKESAQLFASRLEHYVLPSVWGGKKMIASWAKFQGLGLNLQNVLDIHTKKWRPKKGYVYIRCAGGKLARYGLLRLRNFLRARGRRSSKCSDSGAAPRNSLK
jgi:hypothetical protein